MKELDGPRFGEMGREIALNWGLDRDEDEKELNRVDILTKKIKDLSNDEIIISLLAEMSLTLRSIEKKMDKAKKEKKNGAKAPKQKQP